MMGALKRGIQAHMAEVEVPPDTFPKDGSGFTAQACSQGRGKGRMCGQQYLLRYELTSPGQKRWHSKSVSQGLPVSQQST